MTIDRIWLIECHYDSGERDRYTRLQDDLGFFTSEAAAQAQCDRLNAKEILRLQVAEDSKYAADMAGWQRRLKINQLLADAGEPPQFSGYQMNPPVPKIITSVYDGEYTLLEIEAN